MTEQDVTQAEQAAVDEQDNVIPVLFRGKRLWLYADKYRNDQTALFLLDEDEIPYMTCTVLQDGELNDNLVWLKNYAENKGILEALVRAKVLVANGVVKQNGNQHFIQCRILDKALLALGMEVPPSELGLVEADSEEALNPDGTGEDSDVGEVLEGEQRQRPLMPAFDTPVQLETLAVAVDSDVGAVLHEGVGTMSAGEKLASHISDADLAEAIDEALSKYGGRDDETPLNPEQVATLHTPPNNPAEVKQTFTFPSTKKD